MATQKQRMQFVVALAREFPGRRDIDAVARRLLRLGATHCRLAEATCNGEWPCEGPWAEGHNNALRECPQCSGHYARSSYRRDVCPDCRNEALIRSTLADIGAEPVFGGDPRGCTVKVKLPSGTTDDWAREGLCIPTA
jgi:hypothetical protein